jgi:hypothetical protein
VKIQNINKNKADNLCMVVEGSAILTNTGKENPSCAMKEYTVNSGDS